MAQVLDDPRRVVSPSTAAELPHLGIDDLREFALVASPAISPDGTAVAFVVSRCDAATDAYVGHVWLARDGAAPRQLTRGEKGESLPAWSPDGSTLAFVAARGKDAKPQVWLLPAAGGEAHALTSARLGVGEFAWSPDGSRIAFTGVVDTDAEGRVEAAPLVIRRLAHKADGVGRLGSLRSHLFLVDVADGATRQLTSGDHSVAGIAWSPDSTRLAFTTAMHDDRDINIAQHLYVMPSGGGEATRLTPDGWLAGSPLWTRDGQQILFTGSPSLRSLQTGLFTIPADGGEPRDLLLGFDRTVMAGAPGYPGSVPQLTPDGESVVFSARIGGCVHTFRTALEGGATRPLIQGDTTVVSGVSVATHAPRLAAVVSTPENPGDVVVTDLDGGTRRDVTAVNAAVLVTRRLQVPEARTATAADGTSVESWLWRAAEPNAPLLLEIHGGPHNASSPVLSPLFDLWRQDFVARGWSVLAVNARGSDGYGEAFMSAAVGGWGERDFADFMAAVDEVVAAGIADPERLAVTGYSYGGFMTSWIIGHTDRFRAAVAGGVVTDLASFYGTADVGAGFLPVELGDHLHADPELYKRLSPLTYADRITAPTLIIQGEADVRCPVGQAEQLFATLRQLRRDVELVLYPGANHLFIINGRPSHIVDYGKRLVDWVASHVDGSSSSGVARESVNATHP